MKLRFVKFFTSRENEIEKKEEGEGEGDRYLRAPSSPARPRPELPLPPSSTTISILCPFTPPQCPHPPPSQLVSRHVSKEQYSPAIPPPAVPLLPSFFIKLLKQQNVADVTWRSTLPADPASRPSCSGRPARRALAPFTAVDLSSTVSASSRLQVRSIHSIWSHRKTKTENKVPCFVSFIDE